MYVLGFHVGHDSSAALVGAGGKVIAAASEERFTKIKHCSALPLNAMEYCLKQASITLDDVDIVSYGHLNIDRFSRCILEKEWDIAGIKQHSTHRRNSMQKNLLYKLWLALAKIPQLSHMLGTDVALPLYISMPGRGSTVEMECVEHHLAHAASAYYTSGFNGRTLIVTADGLGDRVSMAIWLGEQGKIKLLYQVGQVGSLGLFYGGVTEALGWWHGDGEGKTMGLAPYGEPRPSIELLREFAPSYHQGKLVKGHNFGLFYSWGLTGSEHWHGDDADKIMKLVPTCGQENLAAAAQAILEEQLLDIIISWSDREQVDAVAVSGGVFLNVKANQRIRAALGSRPYHIYPNAGDGGLSEGAALYSYYHATGQSEVGRIDDLCLGPQFSNNEIEAILKERNLSYERYDDIARVCAQLLAQGKIVGWFQGRMEVGPRALGNRSILVDPRKAENKNILNTRVKFREAFRPFCPSLLEEVASEYLVDGQRAPFMVISFDAKEQNKGQIPAVVHVDGTLRPQTIAKEQNGKYYQLIQDFAELTGVPVILNTSFNLKGNPIVCTPRDALRCFYDSGIDCLAIGDFLLQK